MIRHIVALDSQRGIAKNGERPWQLPDDVRYFKAQTMRHGAVVLMGRKTFETIGQPLPGRQNFVLSRNTDLQLSGVTMVHDLPQFLAGQKDVWVIGGAEVFTQTLDEADELYVTKIEADFRCDRFYPDYENKFELVKQSKPKTQNGFRFTYTLYKRKN